MRIDFKKLIKTLFSVRKSPQYKPKDILIEALKILEDKPQIQPAPFEGSIPSEKIQKAVDSASTFERKMRDSEFKSKYEQDMKVIRHRFHTTKSSRENLVDPLTYTSPSYEDSPKTPCHSCALVKKRLKKSYPHKTLNQNTSAWMCRISSNKRSKDYCEAMLMSAVRNNNTECVQFLTIQVGYKFSLSLLVDAYFQCTLNTCKTISQTLNCLIYLARHEENGHLKELNRKTQESFPGLK